MRLLAPLGFIGLAAIAVLILIYIIKPNFQQKVVSSTFIWHRALKLRRRRTPISKLRNILLLICQILILALCAFILVHPVITADEPDVRLEKIAIIDASGNMRATENGRTRFERAVDEVKDLVDEVEGSNGVLTVIIAGEEPRFLANSASGVALSELDKRLSELVTDGLDCTYGVADIDGAIDLAQTVLDDTSDAEVLLYTATEYIDKGNITVVDVSEAGEWNAAILSCAAEVDENYYTFTVETASYGRDIELWLHLDVYGANGAADESSDTPEPPVMLSTLVRCSNDNVQTVVFNTKNSETPIYSYESVHVYLESVSDSMDSDNNYYLYGGIKRPIKVQYYSNKANNFFAGWLLGAREILGSRWSIEITEVASTADAPATPAYEGYDFYIFEHDVPKILPTDGVVLLVDLNKTPDNLLRLGDVVTGDFTLAPGQVHDATAHITANNITITEYRRVLEYYSGFQPLLYCGGDPIYLVCNEPELKVAILSLNLNKSNLSVLIDFPILMYNMFNYYLPSTASDPDTDLPKYVYEVGEEIKLNARGASLTVNGPDSSLGEFKELPTYPVLKNPGQYTLTQTTLRGEQVIESFYVKMPVSESNVVREVDSLKRVQVNVQTKPVDTDLLLWFAIALVALLFLEWLLHSIEHMTR